MRVQIVSFHCVLKNKLGEFISSSFNQDVATDSVSAQEPQLPGLISVLKHLKKGDHREISLSADQAYGFYRPELLVEVPRAKLYHGKYLRVGDEIRGMFGEDLKPRNYRVAACNSKNVSLDGNHPLAGQDLVFNVKVTSSYEEEPDLDQPKPQKLLN